MVTWILDVNQRKRRGRMPAVIYEKRGKIAYITMNRPEVLNAQNEEMRNGLTHAFSDFRDDPDAFVAILSGAGDRAFSSGLDLKGRVAANTAAAATVDLPPGGSAVASARATLLYAGILPWDLSKPVIAAVHGYCLGAGMEISGECDIRIASEDAKFGFPEVKRGLVPGITTHLLGRMIPMGDALMILMTGDEIDAAEAHRVGWVQRVVSRDRLMAEAERIANSILENAPLAVQAAKRICKMSANMPIETAYLHARPIREAVSKSEDAMEGPKAFVEKRKPVYRNR
jgi:dehydration protein DpgD